MDQPPLPLRIVTGANRGVGLAIARGLAPSSRLVVVGRTQTTANAAKGQVLGTYPTSDVTALSADFGSLDEVRRLGDEIRSRWQTVDALVSNAAIIAPQRELSKDGIELQLQVNHLAPFLLTGLLFRPLTQAAGRVVIVASEAHRRASLDLTDLEYERRRYRAERAYSQSKLANVLFANRLAARWEGQVHVNSVHPGVIRTKLLGGLFGAFSPLRLLFRSEEAGAAPVVRLAEHATPLGRTGAYFRRFEEVDVSKAAQDADLQQGLWAASEALVGEDFDRLGGAS